MAIDFERVTARGAAAWATASAVLLSFAGAGCSAPPAEDTGANGALRAPILGGTPDTTHDAVVALLQLDAEGSIAGACTGTIVATKAHSGIVLTAAHCAVEVDVFGEPTTTPLDPSRLYVAPGQDWVDAVLARGLFAVVETWVHPSYDAQTDSPYDIAVVRYMGALPSTPMIPILPAALDNLQIGSPVTLVGYGVTDSAFDNTRRYFVDQNIFDLDARNLAYDQGDGEGICSGDSGGPALYATNSGERVAGVASYGDVDCSLFGVSVRVSAFESFVNGSISDTPSTPSCDDCALAAVAPGNPCRALNLICRDDTSACASYVSCAEACATRSCLEACAANHSAGARTYEELWSCICQDGCALECATDATCEDRTCGGLSSLVPACTTCMKESCCAEAAACAADSTCAACVATEQSSCDGSAPFAALQTCRAGCAGDPCSAAPSVGGAGGTAGGGAGAGAGGTGTGGSAGAALGGSGNAGSGAEAGEGGEKADVPVGVYSPACQCNVPGRAGSPLGLLLGLTGLSLAVVRRSRLTR